MPTERRNRAREHPRVYALPAFRNGQQNPYNAQLYRAVERLGPIVEDVSPSSLLRARDAVLHLHWPEYLWAHPRLSASIVKGAAAALLLALLRARRMRVIWTVHNLHGHERWHPRWDELMWSWFVSRVDGYISLSPGGQARLLERFPVLSHRPGYVIAHGDYRAAYPGEVCRAEARAAFGFDDRHRVIAFVGSLRPYKNVPALIAAVRALTDPDLRLLIAGKPGDESVVSELKAAAGDDARIRIQPGFVPPEQMQEYQKAADLLVFPYRDVLNSGSALLALSFDRPILVPEKGALGELREVAGAEWVRTYSGDLSPTHLADALSWAANVPRDPERLRLLLDWDTIARQTVHAYQTIQAIPAVQPRFVNQSITTT